MGNPNTCVVRGNVTIPDAEVVARAAAVVVQVEDVSRADTPSVVVGEQRRNNVLIRQGVELPFAVDVPTKLIDERHSYSLRVHIDMSGSGDVKAGDFVSTQSYPVLTRGHGDEARVTVKQV